MELKYFGHSCFLLAAADGTRILTDPCDPPVGYTLYDIACNAITSSHAHHDHDYFAAASGTPLHITAPGRYTVGGVRITGVPTYHDEHEGRDRGKNIIFVFDLDGVRVAHLGDLGHVPSAETVAQMGRVDVMLTPVGGTYTIDAEQARAVANLIRPRVLIPMHYKTPSCTLPIAGVDRLLTQISDASIHRVTDSFCTFTPESLGGPRVVVLQPKAKK